MSLMPLPYTWGSEESLLSDDSLLEASGRGKKMSVILCTAGYDHTIRFWEALSGLCSRSINHPDSQVNRLCISPNKQYLAVASHHNVKLYQCRGTDPNVVMTFEGHINNVTGVAFHCDTKWMVTSSEDGTVKIWDVKSGHVQRNYNHGCPVNDVVIHPNQGELIACDRDGAVRVWDLSENRCSHQLIPQEDVSVSSVSVATDGSMLAAGTNSGMVFIWKMVQHNDHTTLVAYCRFAAHNMYITRVLLSPDVRKLATCSADHTAKIWTVNFPDDMAPNGSPDSSAASSDSSTSPLPPNIVHTSNDPDHPNINTSANLQHTHARRGTSSRLLRPRVGGRAMLGLGPMGYGYGYPQEQQGPDSNPLQLEAVLQNHQRWVWDCAFSADSAYLVTACSDHYARLWELNTKTIIRQYSGHHRGLVCVALNDYSEIR